MASRAKWNEMIGEGLSSAVRWVTGKPNNASQVKTKKAPLGSGLAQKARKSTESYYQRQQKALKDIGK